jgi:transcriptional regulator with XRE-family HTH domain
MGKYTKPPNLELRRMIGDRFARLRKQAGWTLEYVAGEADVAIGTIHLIETGKGGSLEVLYDLAQVYGTTLGFIFADTPDKSLGGP